MGRKPKNISPELEKHEAFYTPAHMVREILNVLKPSRADKVLDPCAGAGVFGVELGRLGIPPENITACEIRKDPIPQLEGLGFETHHGDFMQVAKRLSGGYDLIISNPPFSLTTKFVHAAFPLLANGGRLVLLSRVGFIASSGRHTFHTQYPADIHIVPYRPSFIDSGQADRWDYMWNVWHNPLKPGRVYHDIPSKKPRTTPITNLFVEETIEEL